MAFTPNALTSEHIKNKLNQLAIKEAEFSQKLFAPLIKKSSREFEEKIDSLKRELQRELDMAERYGMDSFSKEQIEDIERRIAKDTEYFNNYLEQVEYIQTQATSKDKNLPTDFELIDDFPTEKEYLKKQFYEEMKNAEKTYAKENVVAGIVSLDQSNQEVVSFNQKVKEKGPSIVKDASLACLESVRKQQRVYYLNRIAAQAKIVRFATEKQAKHVQKQMSKNPIRKAFGKTSKKDEVTLSEFYDKMVQKHGTELNHLRMEYQFSLDRSVKSFEQSGQLRESIGLPKEESRAMQNLREEMDNSNLLDSVIEKAQARYREICRPAKEQERTVDMAR